MYNHSFEHFARRVVRLDPRDRRGLDRGSAQYLARVLCDVASPEFHPLVEKAKDVAAGAVLLTAIGSALVGALVFAPHVFG
jgi:hypothetical protein